MSLKLIVICMTSVFCVGYVSCEFCYNDVVGACSPVGGEIANCNARYGAFKSDELLTNVQNYANTHILRSFQFLLMSTHFANYEKNRAGFEKLYKQMSDHTWEKAIDLVKFMGKRGAHMSFRYGREEIKERQMEYEMYELGSMAKALDMQKGLAEGAHFLHGEVTRRKEHDAEVASYLENNFVHQQSDIIRELSGYTNDIKHLIANQPDPSLSLYLFDEYLQKAI